MRAIRAYLPPVNFITIHYAYFIVVCLVSSVIFWGSSDPAFSISYTDSLFLVVSAMTEAGLNTVNLSQMTTWQQVLLWLLIGLGSSVWVSIWTVLARKHAFERRFHHLVQRSRLRSSSASLQRRPTLIADLPLIKKFTTTFSRKETVNSTAIRDPATGLVLPVSDPVAVHRLSGTTHSDRRDITDVVSGDPSDATDPSEAADPLESPGRNRISFANGAAQPKGSSTGFEKESGPRRRHASGPGESTLESGPQPLLLNHRHFLTSEKVGRNAQFHDLSTEEREHLGGTEYRALKVLSIAVPIYFFAWQSLGCIAVGAWISVYYPEPAQANAVNPWWNGIFNGVSAFNNSGMSVRKQLSDF
jgi:hypothetical protein